MGNQLQATPLSLALSFTIVAIGIAISYKEKLRLEKDMIIAIIRMIVQLIAVAYVLEFIFRLDQPIVTLGMILVIIINASINAAGRGRGLRRPFIISFIALFVTSAVILSILVLSNSIEFTPVQMIPISGMIIGNSMKSIGLAYSNLFQLFKDQRQSVLERLALGASPFQASQDVLRLTVKNGLQPTVDGVKTTGIVTLPGMMSGLIIAGVDPLTSIIYQIMIMFMMVGATALSTYIATYLAYRSFYNDRSQLYTRLPH